MRRRATALGTALKEDLIAFGRLARREHGDVLADDVESSRVVLGRDDKRFRCHTCSLPPWAAQRIAAHLPAAAR